MKLQLIIFTMLLTTTESFSQTPKNSETVSLNGSKIYYEVYGKGTPLFFLHGFTWTSQSWLPYIGDFINDYEVYLIDLKGHGKSGAFTEKLSIKSAAEDVNSLINYLKLDSIHAIGYSYGGDVLFQLALLHPGLIKSMVVIGACGICNIKDFPEWIDKISYKNIDNLPWMREVQTSEAQIKSIFEQLPNYNATVSIEEFKSIQTRTLIVIGDQEDGLHWDDIFKAKNNLPNSSLWVLPNTPHGAHRDKNKDDFVRISNLFFKPDYSMENNTSQSNIATVKKAVQGVNDRNFAAVSECLTNNFQRHDLTDFFPVKEDGKAQGMNFLQELMKAIPDIQFNIQDIFSDDSRAVIRFQFTGTQTGELFNFPPTGTKVNFSGVNIYRFENGKIAEVWQLWDWAGVLRQIGVFNLEKLRKK